MKAPRHQTCGLCDDDDGDGGAAAADGDNVDSLKTRQINGARHILIMLPVVKFILADGSRTKQMKEQHTAMMMVMVIMIYMD